MTSTRLVAILAILNAMVFCLSDSFAQAGQPKGELSHRGGQATAHMSNNGQENTNAQWSADPERGWVRADERHDLNDQRHATEKPKGRGPKGKASGKTRY